VDPDKSGRADVIRDHRTVIIEKAGHWVHHDQLPRFLETVEDFLAEETAPARKRA